MYLFLGSCFGSLFLFGIDKNIKSQSRKREKTKENKRKCEKVKCKLKIFKKCVDNENSLWYDIQADATVYLLHY